MVRINFSQLKKLPVQTLNGVYLGKVIDVVLSPEDNLISQYKVRANKIFGRTFLINSNQVLAIEKNRILVEDAFLSDTQPISGSVAESSV